MPEKRTIYGMEYYRIKLHLTSFLYGTTKTVNSNIHKEEYIMKNEE